MAVRIIKEDVPRNKRIQVEVLTSMPTTVSDDYLIDNEDAAVSFDISDIKNISGEELRKINEYLSFDSDLPGYGVKLEWVDIEDATIDEDNGDNTSIQIRYALSMDKLINNNDDYKWISEAVIESVLDYDAVTISINGVYYGYTDEFNSFRGHYQSSRDDEIENETIYMAYDSSAEATFKVEKIQMPQKDVETVKTVVESINNDLSLVSKKLNNVHNVKGNKSYYDRYKYSYDNSDYVVTKYTEDSYFNPGRTFVQKLSAYDNSDYYYAVKNADEDTFSVYKSGRKFSSTNISDPEEMIMKLDDDFNSAIESTPAIN